MKSLVMKNAWVLLRAGTCINWSDCLKTAWRNQKAVAKLNSGVVEFSFRKKDGTIRQAVGTRSLGIIPAQFHPKTDKQPAPSVLPFFDIDKQAWRSFQRHSIVEI